uniref:Uncharacterized protein n=1 Tax=Globodera rostochiensis TaxID=31243 RepID=A0A914I4N9_GLORO
MRAAFPTSYSYAYDDKIATEVCQNGTRKAQIVKSDRSVLRVIKKMVGMSPIVLLILSIFKVGEMARLGGQNSLPAVHQPAQIHQNSNTFLQQIAVNNQAINNKPFGENAADIGTKKESSHKKDRSKHFNSGIKSQKKGIKVGGKVKLLQKHRQMKSKNFNEKKGRLGLFLFYVFMLFSMIVPEVPQNVFIHRNNQFVPIEQNYLTCRPMLDGAGHQCVFSVDEMIVNSNQKNIEIWANLNGDNNTLQLLGQKDISMCETENDHAYCESNVAITPDQIDQLKVMPIDELKDSVLQSADNHGRKLDEAVPIPNTVEFNLINNCPYNIWVGAMSRAYATTNTSIGAGLSQRVNVPNPIEAARFWAMTDCDHPSQPCNFAGAVPPVSLQEATLNADGSQFLDVSYVDGVNVPISVNIPNCHPGQVPASESITFTGSGDPDILAKLVPLAMVKKDQFGKTKVQSICSAYQTDETCCRGQYGTPDTCGPKVWNETVIIGYNAMAAAFPDSYSYAYDDLKATKVCQGATEFEVSFCAKPENLV